LREDKNGRLRGMGRGMTMSKLSALQISERSVANLQERVKFLEKLLLKDKASIFFFLLFY